MGHLACTCMYADVVVNMYADVIFKFTYNTVYCSLNQHQALELQQFITIK